MSKFILFPVAVLVGLILGLAGRGEDIFGPELAEYLRLNGLPPGSTPADRLRESRDPLKAFRQPRGEQISHELLNVLTELVDEVERLRVRVAKLEHKTSFRVRPVADQAHSRIAP